MASPPNENPSNQITTSISVLMVLGIIAILISLNWHNIASTYYSNNLLASFIENPISLLILACILAVLSADLHNASGWTSRFAPIAEAIVVAIFVGFIIEIPHFQNIFLDGVKNTVRDVVLPAASGLTGAWRYSAIFDKEEHLGVAFMEQSGDNIYIHGTLAQTRRDGDRGSNRKPREWRSETVSIRRDGPVWRILFKYRIDGIDDVYGYCNVVYTQGSSPPKMTGADDQIYPAADGKSVEFVVMHGNITFTKIVDGNQ
ncbi:hypothetical protein [Methylocystis sp. SC2]|uniref:hypothetical protein n=1 Tax=Methylocystis sp. (strain SC2) TaxID=187303 RepID=UPI0011D254F2|nr:hypothetical protein [Methylocystis sp. SC2]